MSSLSTPEAAQPQRPGLLERLRSHTRAAHTRLENLPVSRSIMDPALDVLQYARYLKLMYAVHADAEQHIYPLLAPLFPDMEQRMKTHKIARDLVFLEQEMPEDTQLPLSLQGVAPSGAFALGMMYVVEGSSLGGRVILKHITKVLPLTETRGASYFSGYGTATAAMWNAFLKTLETFPNGAGDEADIIAGAEQAFNRMHDFMQ